MIQKAVCETCKKELDYEDLQAFKAIHKDREKLKLQQVEDGVFTPKGDKDSGQIALAKALGTADGETTGLLMTQLINALPGVTEEDLLLKINQALPLLAAIAPRDELEGMLAIQMVSIHTMSMEMMRRSMLSSQPFNGVDSGVNRVAKLTRTFIAQIEALNKHRGKGQQKMTIEHVHINEGGQAVIGHVAGGGDEKKK